MLPAGHRLTSGEAFRHAVRRGRRTGTRSIVLHLDESAPDTPCRVGLVVSKAVGTAVTRNRVKRRLRHLIRERLALLPDSGVLVVRAQPPAAAATWADLGSDVDRCLAKLGRPTGVPA